MHKQPSYLLLLGSTPNLSFAELQAILPHACHLERLSAQVATLTSLPSDSSPVQLIDQLGGTVKIAEVLTAVDPNDPTAPSQFLEQWLLTQPDSGKLTIAIAEWGRDHLPPFDIASLKDKLQAAGRSVRYLTDTRAGLSAALLLHKRSIQEFVLVSTDQALLVARTVGVQNIDQWTLVDRGKPFAQHQRGLLPPKVARIMVNLALQQAWLSPAQLRATQLWDPYCGAGTILFEAARMGVGAAYGSDSDQEAVSGAQTNLDWFAHTIAPSLTEPKSALTVFKSDATHVDQPPFTLNSITAVVTEPFLGKQTPDPRQIPNIYKGLTKLYLGAFKAWRRWLKPGATVVHITPRWHNPSQHFASFIDNLQTIGYTTTSDPILYARPHAQVQRDIWILKYHTS